MSSSIQIHIFGTLSNPEAIWDLGNAAAAETTLDWITDFRVADFSALLEAAAREERALMLVNSNTGDLIDAVRSACMDAGLSYVAHYGPTGAEGYTNGIAYRPDTGGEFEFLLSGSDGVMLPLSAIRKAQAKGPAAMDAMISEIAEKTQIGKLVVTPEFQQEFEEYSGYTWGTSTPAPGLR